MMLGWLFALLFITARAEFTVPALTGPVIDQAGMLSAETERQMDAFLRQLRDSGGSQLQILTVPALDGLTIEEAAIKVAQAWKLGDAKADNGILLLLAQTERRVRIEVGQGREGDLPDVRASRIIREVIVPRMREGDADRAITAGVFAILHYTDPQFLESRGEAVPRERRVGVPLGKKIELIVWLLFFFIVVLPGLFMRRRRRGLWGLATGYGLGRGLGGGGWSGGGGFGGGGGGSWGGGGGGFSGGGASGGW